MTQIKSALIAVVIFMTFSAITATAQTSEQYVRFGGGISLINEPDEFSDYWYNGWMANVNYGFPVYFEFSVELDATFQHFGFDDEKFLADLGLDPSEVALDGTTIQIYTVFLNGVFQPEFTGPVIPYIKGGLGMMVLRQDDTFIQDFTGTSESLFGDELIEYGFGFQVLVGLDYFINQRSSLFVQGGLQQGYPDGEMVRVFPITAGFRVNVF